MEVLRAPDERFAGLADYPFAPHYLTVTDADGTDLRIHYVDEGPRDAAPVLLMHGEPSWSYLYRKFVPALVARGHRVIAPDLIGFGRSDKPVRRDAYTYQRHVDWMAAVLMKLDLRDVTLVAQDWGGLIGLRLVAEHPARFARVVAANTFLPTGDRPLGPAFDAWRHYSQETPEFHVGNIVQGGCATQLPPEIVAAYDAPFPDDRYKAGARVFPSLVPTAPDDPAAAANRAAWEVLARFDKPFLTAFSDGDPITGGGDRIFQKVVPGAQGRPHVTLPGGGHFLQEDVGPELARVVAQFVAGT